MPFTFDANRYNNASLLMMLNGIRHAHQSDADTPAGQPKEFGVYETGDWKIQSDEIEKVLRERGQDFDQVPW